MGSLPYAARSNSTQERLPLPGSDSDIRGGNTSLFGVNYVWLKSKARRRFAAESDRNKMNNTSPQRATGLAPLLLIFWLAVTYATTATGQPSFTNVTMLNGRPRMTILGEVGATNQILSIAGLSQTNWAVLTNIVVTQNPYTFVDSVTSPGPQRYYRVVDPNCNAV